MSEEVKQKDIEDTTKRDFLKMTTGCIAAAGCVAAGIPLVRSLAPDAGVLAAGETEVDVSAIKPGEMLTVVWQGKPVFIKHRTDAEISAASSAAMADLRDPQTDADRVKPGHEKWLVVLGVCTHLGCVPIGNKGEFGGWFCPCHGSHYDTSGRIRKGPAPNNLVVPPYIFISDNLIKIG